MPFKFEFKRNTILQFAHFLTTLNSYNWKYAWTQIFEKMRSHFLQFSRQATYLSNFFSWLPVIFKSEISLTTHQTARIRLHMFFIIMCRVIFIMKEKWITNGCVLMVAITIRTWIHRIAVSMTSYAANNPRVEVACSIANSSKKIWEFVSQ